MSRNVRSSSPTDLQISESIERIEKENCLIELPFTSDIINIRDLTSYVKSESNLIHRHLTDSILQNLSKFLYQQLDKQSQIFYILRLILNENYLFQQRKKLDFTNLNIDDILNTYIGKSIYIYSNNYLINSL